MLGENGMGSRAEAPPKPADDSETPTGTGKELLTIEEANQLVVEHQGWAESIARAVARAWNLDWRSDGLDGAAMEALIFCARRFQPGRGVPFKGYARKRIHEASTEAARKSRGWQKTGMNSRAENMAKEVSTELLGIFPELRHGHIPVHDDAGGAEGELRSAIRHMLVGASILATKHGQSECQPDDALDYKKMVRMLAEMPPLHQLLIWKVYWEGLSLRSVASEWNTDELNVIREHKVILGFMQKGFQKGRSVGQQRVRPGLRHAALLLKKDEPVGIFTRMISGASSNDQ